MKKSTPEAMPVIIGTPHRSNVDILLLCSDPETKMMK
jgi:hypothetical protein